MADNEILPDVAPLAEPVAEPEQTDNIEIDPKNAGEPIESIFYNYANNKKIVEEVDKKIATAFTCVQDRSDLETIWDNNDKMFRCQPLNDSQKENRANFGAGEFHVSINQLQSMTYKVITENPNSYKYQIDDTVQDEGMRNILENNAKILNSLLYRAFSEMDFKKQLRRIIHDFFVKANCSAMVEWCRRIVKWAYKNKKTGKLEYQDVTEFSLPMLYHERVDQVWLDPNLDDIGEQPYVFLRRPITWTNLLIDEKNGKIKMPKFDTTDEKRDRDAYKENKANEFETHKSDAVQNSDRDFSDRSREAYKHWVIYMHLPIKQDTPRGTWDEMGMETLYRIRILGDPGHHKILEIRESPLPGGIPLLWSSQTADNIGMYAISLGEKVKTFYEQLCTAYNQEVDNRAKNTRRPIVYDAMRGQAFEGHDFGHSGLVPVEGNPNEIFAELQLADMTGTIQATKSEIAYKIKEITNTTEAVTGQAMGGRTSASEYMGAKIAATTPIFADMAQFEDDIIVGYMRKFHAAVNAYMTLEDIVDMVGDIGKTYNFGVAGRYKIVARGVIDAIDSNQMINNLMQLLAQTQDANSRNRILLRIAEAMKLDNPNDLIPKLATDEAVKAALFENNEMLIYGKQDMPEIGEQHDVHLPIHVEARWNAVRSKDPNVWIIDQHINETERLKRQDQVASAAQPFPAYGQQAEVPQAPGQESGQQISAQAGNINGGSQMPM